MKTYNVGFINSDGWEDETQLDIKEDGNWGEDELELINLILSLKEEMCIEEIIYIEQVFEEEN